MGCADAFSSVMQANLTLFQIALGDGWSSLARPVMEHQPLTAVIFIGVIFTMSFGLLNVVVAVMVENAAQGREAETHFLALEKEEQKDRARACFKQMCKRLDT